MQAVAHTAKLDQGQISRNITAAGGLAMAVAAEELAAGENRSRYTIRSRGLKVGGVKMRESAEVAGDSSVSGVEGDEENEDGCVDAGKRSAFRRSFDELVNQTCR